MTDGLDGPAPFDGSACTVPPLPPPPQALAERRAAARDVTRMAIDRATPDARALLEVIRRRVAVESIAAVAPSLSAPTGPALLPPRRRFLTPEQHARTVAVERALRTASTAVELDVALPRVLHAASSTVFDRVDPGCYRTGASAWHREDEPVEHPPADQCATLVAAAIDLVRRAPADPADLAAWLAFTTMTIHPFVDGNGRVARLLAVAVVAALGGPSGPAPIEWWAADRAAYGAALRAGQPRRPYDGADRSAAPFLEFAARAEIASCRLTVARLRAIETGLALPELQALDAPSRGALLHLLVDGWLDPDVADGVPVGAAQRDWVRVVRRPASLPPHPSGRAVVAGGSVPATIAAWRQSALTGAAGPAVGA